MTSKQQPKIVMLATDLMFSSNVSGFAADRSVKFVRVDSAERLTEQLQDCDTDLVVIDLGIELPNLDALLDSIPDSLKPSAIAFAPHVHTEKLNLATEAGIGRVMTRGQFSAQTGRIVHSFADQIDGAA